MHALNRSDQDRLASSWRTNSAASFAESCFFPGFSMLRPVPAYAMIRLRG